MVFLLSMLRQFLAKSCVSGTSTFDGYSIAYAVIKKLNQMGCRTLFSTHYHMLTEEFSNDRDISLCHMDAITGDNEG